MCIFATEFDFTYVKVNEKETNNDPTPTWHAGCDIVYQYDDGIDIVGACGIFSADSPQLVELCKGESDGDHYAERHSDGQ